ncbi:Beta-barrel assembly-enhancing protease [Usitatibacter rugosus]|uniref:protein O-GlcNAc transferase n=1 Tax=Usitatibacter rugosus TaxID=2732067 RepID=A0A6M4GTY0_9PROT|nr:tetratricopeptide repeat protein [Usitatibacter rugosus]QJR10781.1 Beta-barrel assembly-enhancing protease [Usitatibacter rugosus]
METLSDAIKNAMQHLQQGSLPEARGILHRLLATAPTHAEALHLAGVVELQAGAPQAAIGFLRRCVEVAPGVAFAWSNLGVAYNASGDFTNALACHEKTLALEPGNPVVLRNLGIALRYLGRHDEAMASFERAAGKTPDDPELRREIGDLLVDMGRPGDAVAHYARGLAANPRDTTGLHNRGYAFYRMGNAELAIQDYRAALKIDPRFARAMSSLAVVLNERGESAEAVDLLERAVQREPGNARFHNNLGIALDKLGRASEALAAYGRAIELDAGYAEAYANRGATLNEMKRHAQALADYDRAIELAPELPYNPGHRLHIQMHLCDWTGLEGRIAGVADAIAAGKLAAEAFVLCAVPVPPDIRRKCAELCARDVLRSTPIAAWDRPAYGHQRLRIGYFSADFRNHPVAYLVAPLAERHDRSKVETFAYSFGPDTGDATRKRLERAFDHFDDVRARSDADIVALARQHELDIAIDLMGHTTHARLGIFARRAAPIQAQYLGFPGTMGTSCMDYVIADETVVPPTDEPYYTERIARLPVTYQVNDLGREIAAEVPARTAVGLPERGLVFCCFNNKAKITPDVFSAWMRILAAVPGSVLWMVESEAIAAENLRREAKSRGIDPERLVFAPRVPLAQHLARVRNADLFLDTYHYNGHATTSDTLLAGVPGITCLGDAFPGRVAASLLRAVGLPELVTETLPEYEALAVRLAQDAGALRQLREKLERNRATEPLFDATRFARDLEALYARLHAARRDT